MINGQWRCGTCGKTQYNCHCKPLVRLDSAEVFDDILRADGMEMPRMTRTPEGYLQGEAVVTKAGVFRYLNLDGGPFKPYGDFRYELRHPDDVFDSVALDSFKSKPVVMDHPSISDHPERLVDAGNAKRLSVGHMGEGYRLDSARVIKPVTVTDASAVAAIDAGKQALSLGYRVKLIKEEGQYQGQRYDYRQTNIRGNHLAIVDSARAGPDARMRLDSGDAVQAQPTKEQQMDPALQAQLDHLNRMHNVRVDGIEYKASPEVSRALDKAQARGDAAEGTVTKLTAERDALQGRVDALEAEKVKFAKDEPTRVEAAVQARVDLMEDAKLVLGDKLDRKGTTRVIREAVVVAANPEIKLDGKSDEYVTAMFDHAVAAKRAAVQATNRGGNAGSKGKDGTAAKTSEQVNADGAEPDMEKSRGNYTSDMTSAWMKRKKKAA